MSDMFPPTPMRIYFDVCCLNRVFDDQAQDRIHMESEAVATILGHVDGGDYTWITSDAIEIELNRMREADRRIKTLRLLSGSSSRVKLTVALEKRAEKLIDFGFKPMDALHVACAESAEVDVFLTTDDKLEKLGVKYAEMLVVRIANPWKWLEELKR